MFRNNPLGLISGLKGITARGGVYAGFWVRQLKQTVMLLYSVCHTFDVFQGAVLDIQYSIFGVPLGLISGLKGITARGVFAQVFRSVS